MTKPLTADEKARRAAARATAAPAAETIEWTTAEWADDVLCAYVDGIEATVDASHAWAVKPTSERSETPELYSTGVARSQSAAKRAALASLKKANASYGRPNLSAECDAAVVEAERAASVGGPKLSAKSNVVELSSAKSAPAKTTKSAPAKSTSKTTKSAPAKIAKGKRATSAKLSTDSETIPTNADELRKLIKITRDRRWRAGKRDDAALVAAMTTKLDALTAAAAKLDAK